MNQFCFPILLFFLLLAGTNRAQQPDTTLRSATDTVASPDTPIIVQPVVPVKTIDSFSMRPVTGWKADPSISMVSPQFRNEVLKHHPFFGFSAKPAAMPVSDVRVVKGKELLFYVLVFLLMLFGFLKRAFPKYFADLFRLFFRTTIKQRQIRDQLMQTPLPSLLLNAFFVVSAGMYTTFLLRHFNFDPVGNFWLLFLYCCIGLSAAYFVKFIGLKISGWLFNMPEAANSYIFIVFIVNKMIGILLLPFLIVLAFTRGDFYTVGLTLSWCLIGGLLIYRFVLTYAAVRNQVRVNPFHFFLYLLAFEVAPLLLVYKGLLFYFGQTA